MNDFNMDTYRSIIYQALDKSYKFVTLGEFVALGCPNKKHFIIRHDVDKTPSALSPIIEVERAIGVRSTVFIRVAGAEYNPFSYPSLRVFKAAEQAGAEIGLHTSFYEYAQINGLNDPMRVLRGELDVLRAFFEVRGVAPHRDINYAHNSLPFLEQEWYRISTEMGFTYHAYEHRILASTTYVNEGFNPHLCWRNKTPFEAIEQDDMSIYMLTHPHWWFEHNPFEAA